ncbi:BTB/POZ domain-containing protein 6-like [Paramacrobiotus metropolitanus]|uniref:BTB/POZ domain-containing protein 6-like n=1 Tax=Paramacrobiotus metropolitanus TaxID=2943436 RepID=UPI0024457E28|nr:BTB/POZ domain-containing protein 6-like [Paramacrobiotus metropolitanus]
MPREECQECRWGQSRFLVHDLPDIHPEGFANMASYMYTDAVKTFTLDNVFHTMCCAGKYKLPRLGAICADFVTKDLDINNCLDVISAAMQYASAAPNILEKCLCLIDESRESVWESEQFDAIALDALALILQRDTLTASEDIICSSVDRWAVNMCTLKNVDTSAANRREVLGQTLFLIRFPLMTMSQLLNGPVKSGLLLQSEGRGIYQYKYATIEPQLPFPTEPRQMVRDEGVLNHTFLNVKELSEGAHRLSDPVAVGKLLWTIQLEKVRRDSSATLGFFLRCSGCPKPAPWTCQASAELRLLSWKTGNTIIKKHISHLFDKNSSAWGYSKYISMKELLAPANGYVNSNDFSLKLQIQMAVTTRGIE